jgi:hypothetical protein
VKPGFVFEIDSLLHVPWHFRKAWSSSFKREGRQ